MIVTDASIWVSRFMPGDTFHQQSRAWVWQATASGLTLAAPTLMLAEVSGAIARRVGDVKLGYEIVQQIRRLPNVQLVPLDETLADFAAQVASAHRLRGADAVYVAVAHHLGASLVSWDQEQVDRASDLIVAHRPDQEA